MQPEGTGGGFVGCLTSRLFGFAGCLTSRLFGFAGCLTSRLFGFAGCPMVGELLGGPGVLTDADCV